MSNPDYQHEDDMQINRWDRTTCDPRPGAVYSKHEKCGGIDCTGLPQMPESSREECAEANRPSAITEIWKHETAALIRRLRMERKRS